MKAKFNHLTILSEDHYALGRFYEGFFHMRPTAKNGATQDVRLGDGSIGLNIKPRLPGHAAQLDHFGIEVDDLAEACARLREYFPNISVLASPGKGPHGSVSTHDPVGNIFILSQTGMTDHDDIYQVEDRRQDRVVDHIGLRVRHPRQVAEFYMKVFDLTPIDQPDQGKNIYLSDGHITLAIIPWTLSDFENTGISARGMDHIGFKVESLDALKADMDRAIETNYRFRPSASVVGRGKEGAARRAMFQRTCPLGHHHMADSDGLLLDVTQ